MGKCLRIVSCNDEAAADMHESIEFTVVPFVYTPMGVSQVGFTRCFGLRHVKGRSLVLCGG